MVKEEEQTEDKDRPKVFEKSCPYCSKPFYSLSEKQLLFNYTSHIGSCKFKNEKKKARGVGKAVHPFKQKGAKR